jgi:hypothetical protein
MSAFIFRGLVSFCFGFINIYFADSITFWRSTALIFSEIYSVTFSLLSFFIPIVKEVMSATEILSSALSKNRLVKMRNQVMIIQRDMTAKVGFTERINPERIRPLSAPSP